MTKVSIIVVCLNNEATVGCALDSIYFQSHKDIEVIVIDGKSTDNTLEVVKKRNIKNIKIISEPDSGIYDAMNKGIRAASGDIIGFLNSDDMLADRNVVYDIVDKFTKTDINLVYGNLHYISNKEPSFVIRNWVSGKFSKFKLNYGWMPPHPTVYIKRELYELHGLFNTEYKISGDYDLLLRILSDNYTKVSWIDRTLVHMRTGGISNRSLKCVIKKISEDYTIIRKNNLLGPVTLVFKSLSKVKQYF